MMLHRRQWDVAVIGGGLAALAAALTARSHGATVLMIEASPKAYRGGNTRHARNCRLAHSEETPFSQARYTVDEFAADIFSAAGGRIDSEMALCLASGSAAIPAWLSANRALLQPWADGQIPWSRKTVFFLGGGKTLLNALYATAIGSGVDIIYDCEAVSLRFGTRNGHDVIVARGRQSECVTARSVITCSGGYQANFDRLQEYWGQAARDFIVRGSRYALGNILAQLWSAGAQETGHPADCHIIPVDARSPQFDGGIITRIDGLADGVVLDKFGRQLHVDSSTDRTGQYSAWGRAIAATPDQMAFLLQRRDQLASLSPRFFPPIEIDSAPPSPLVPASVLQSANARTGVSVITPLRPGISFTGLGVKIDSAARPIWQHGKISGIFAAGMIAAGNFIRGRYLSGLGTTISIVFGRIAGQEAARHALG